MTHEIIEANLALVKREYHTLSRIPKPKPPKEENPKIEDYIKNGTELNIEEMLVNF